MFLLIYCSKNFRSLFTVQYIVEKSSMHTSSWCYFAEKLRKFINSVIDDSGERATSLRSRILQNKI